MEKVDFLESLKSAIYVAMKRPGAFLFISILTFILSNIETYLVLGLLSVPIEFIKKGQGDILASIMQFIQIVVDTEGFITKVLIYLIGLFFISVVVSFVLSGYLYLINNIVDKKEKVAGEFMTGVKMYFGRIFSATLRSIFVLSLVIIFLSIGIIPAIITSDTLITKGMDMVALIIILDIVSFMMVFFGLMFCRTYISFWFPSIYKFKSHAFKVAKKSVDGFFWDVVEKFVVFDVVFIIGQVIYMLFYYNSKGVFSYFPVLFNWVFKTMFALAFITYIFRSFRYYSTQAMDKSRRPGGKYNATSHVGYMKNKGSYRQKNDMSSNRSAYDNPYNQNQYTRENFAENKDVKIGKFNKNKYMEFDNKYTDTYRSQ